jgi:hypothetical protein
VPYRDPVWQETGIFKGLSIAFCSTCGFGFSAPEIADETINEFYAHVYRGRGSPFYTDFAALARPVAPDYRSLAQLVLARHFVEFEPGDRFVDIGPGAGRSFASAASVLRRPQMYAVELNDGAALAYRRVYGVETFRGVDALSQQGCRSTIVLSSHSLEHFRLRDLTVFLTSVSTALQARGVFVAEVPCVDLRVHRDVRGSDSPHFLFFSKDSLRRILQSSGFDVLFLETCAQTYAGQDEIGGHSGALERSGARGVAVRALNLMPESVTRLLRRLYFRLGSGTIDLSRDDFAYGGDRTCLRAVARPAVS